MPSTTAKRALAIFFLIFGIGLAVFILTQGIDIYSNSKGYASETTEPSIECIKYFYEIESISYDSGELSFTLKNLDYSKDFANITIEGRTSQTLPLNLPRGTSQQVRVAADLTDSFRFYPDGCAVYKTTCTLAGECSSK